MAKRKYQPKVGYDHPDTVRQSINWLVDADTIELRDLALDLLDDLESARAELRAQSGRLLPSGGEEQYRIVWSGQEGTYVDGEIDDLQDGLDHLPFIRGLSFVKEAHLERRILTDWSPVVSDNSEGESSG